ncbi:MAG: M1 family metallopeptidase [Pyrinomonadaceae bacterium]
MFSRKCFGFAGRIEKMEVNKDWQKFVIVFWMLLTFSFVLPAKAQTALFEVAQYDAEIMPNLIDRSIQGKVSITFNALVKDLKEITLNAGVLEIDAVKQGSSALRFEKKDGLLKIQLDRPLKIGEKREVEIVYHGTPKFGIQFFPEQKQVYTIFSTSQWMPCVDAPDDRAAFRLNLITPNNLKTIGNGNFLKQIVLPNGKTSWRWEQKNAVPTYLFGFAFGEFQELTEQEKGTTFRYLYDKSFSAEQVRKIFADSKDMLRFFESKAGVKYPYKTYTQVLTAGNAQQEVDGFTLMTAEYGRDVLKNEKDIWLGTHEFAHQWWGNMVTNRDWTHFWLNEGIANFMTAAYFEHRFGRAEYLSEIKRYRESYEKVRDAGKDKSLVFPDWNRPTREDRRLVYDKGAYVMQLLREELGEELFWQGLKEYTQKYWGKSVETRDFQTSMEKASGKDLSRFFDKWVYLKSN